MLKSQIGFFNTFTDRNVETLLLTCETKQDILIFVKLTLLLLNPFLANTRYNGHLSLRFSQLCKRSRARLFYFLYFCSHRVCYLHYEKFINHKLRVHKLLNCNHHSKFLLKGVLNQSPCHACDVHKQ